MRLPLACYHPALSLGFNCMDCGCDTRRNEQYYMVRNGLWRSVNPKVDGMLCLPCLERRLARGLRARDFTGARLNAAQARVCPELALRLARRATWRGGRQAAARRRR